MKKMLSLFSALTVAVGMAIPVSVEAAVTDADALTNAVKRGGKVVLDRAFAASVTLNDGGFKRNDFQFRYIKSHLAGDCSQFAALVAKDVPMPGVANPYDHTAFGYIN